MFLERVFAQVLVLQPDQKLVLKFQFLESLLSHNCWYFSVRVCIVQYKLCRNWPRYCSAVCVRLHF